MDRNEIIMSCDCKFRCMDIWYILDHQNQLKVIRGILQCFRNYEKLSPRQFVRLFDFVYDVDLYRTYSKDAIGERMDEIEKTIGRKNRDLWVF